ncbi:hypothetical protein FHR22_003052 [Sphingopyxis panaciterrae]|uniref:hypothetical protein n=1 Tax=Sphingopyxis panaciterrae TaxID=363841 RepID=UPI00142113D7|nr:hypothetical protein [Sphingopyxis panaciterrae]NIJ38341.1 hypothetical protein [Sphingopyxis panaciterrae]
MIGALLLMAAQIADPGLAASAAIAQPAAPPSIADTDVREFAAIAGRKVVGRPVGGPVATADKLLILARDDKGFPDIAGSFGLPSRQSLPPPPRGTLAIIRLHQRSETIVPGPTTDDLAFVAANRIPLFVIGEWARPAPMWEVAWVDDAVRFRTIGEVGEIGPWRE